MGHITSLSASSCAVLWGLIRSLTILLLTASIDTSWSRRSLTYQLSMPKLYSRRRFILRSTAFVGAAAIVGGGVLALRTSRLQTHGDRSHTPQALRLLIDTIVPEDDFAGGLSIGLDTRLTTQMQQQPALQQLIDRVTPAIDKQSLAQHKKAFVTLDLNRREELLNRLLTDTSQRQLRTDLNKLRSLVLQWYYRSDAGHQSLGYRLPAHYAAYADVI